MQDKDSMKKYQINIAGMHCSGCSNLIKMSLEDAGLRSVQIDMNNKSGQFESEKDQNDLELILGQISQELHDYGGPID